MNTDILGFPTTPILPVSGSPMDFAGSTEFGPFTADVTQRHAIGRLFETWDGRRFRYSKAGAVALVQSLMTQGPVPSAKQIGQVQTGYGMSVGDKDNIRCLVTTGGIAGGEAWTVENALAGGFLICHSVSPAVLGDYYMIVKSKMYDETHIDIWLDTPIRNAIGATGLITLMQSKFNSTVVAVKTTLTARAVGVPICPVPAGYYYWGQTKGPCPMIVDTGDTITVGAKVGVPATNAVAGTCGAATATLYAFPIYGTCLQVSTGDTTALIDLELE